MLYLYSVSIGTATKKTLLKMLDALLKSLSEGSTKAFVAVLMYPFVLNAMSRFKPYYDESTYAGKIDFS